MGIEREIEGSKGLTLNMTIYIDYAINNSQRLIIKAGSPLIFRAVRPDGLTKKYIINIEFSNICICIENNLISVISLG